MCYLGAKGNLKVKYSFSISSQILNQDFLENNTRLFGSMLLHFLDPTNPISALNYADLNAGPAMIIHPKQTGSSVSFSHSLHLLLF